MSSTASRNNHFTVNLISNASLNFYPNNKLSSFRTVLPLVNGLELEGAWEVALSEIVFPTMMKNVTDGGYFQFRNKQSDNVLPPMGIGNGIYRSVKDLLDAMLKPAQEYFAQQPFLWQYTIDPTNQKLSIELNSGTSFLHFISSDIANILGYVNHTKLEGMGPHVADYPVDLQRVHTMFVYTDIIEHQLLGDSMAPVLRAVPIYSALSSDTPSSSSSAVDSERMFCKQTQIVKSFDHLEFKRVLSSTINTISIELHNETGQYTQFFDIGRVALTLTFRKAAYMN